MIGVDMGDEYDVDARTIDARPCDRFGEAAGGGHHGAVRPLHAPHARIDDDRSPVRQGDEQARDRVAVQFGVEPVRPQESLELLDRHLGRQQRRGDRNEAVA